MTKVLPPPARSLTDEEIDLWLTVTAGVKRRPGNVLPVRLAKPAAKPKQMKASDLSADVEGGAAHRERRAPVLPPPAPLELKLRQKLSRGRQAVDAAIDLHGLRQDQAYRALRQFLGGAQADGARVALVVTGKGDSLAGFSGLSEGRGILRRTVPLWLGQAEFRALVGGFSEASPTHGGAGALYVRLRRVRTS